MATNFEFYKDELIKSLRRVDKGICIAECVSNICAGAGGLDKECEFTSCNLCIADVLEFLGEKHIEQPKLTEREREFCAAVGTGWIAREADQAYWFMQKPELVLDDDTFYWRLVGGHSVRLKHMEFDFRSLAEEQCYNVQDLLKRDVMDEGKKIKAEASPTGCHFPLLQSHQRGVE